MSGHRVVDNCNGNRGEQGGLLVMIDIARRLEYIFLKKTSRPNIGKFVATEIVSCQLHDSNLINVQLSRTLRVLDLGECAGIAAKTTSGVSHTEIQSTH